MKRVAVAVSLGAAVVTLTGFGLGLAWARPDLVPPWARLRLPAATSADAGSPDAGSGLPEVTTAEL
ncbi:MAG TPA: hypothetical protein VF590_04810, partial [Isosphaeraceae bacterium]